MQLVRRAVLYALFVSFSFASVAQADQLIHFELTFTNPAGPTVPPYSNGGYITTLSWDVTLPPEAVDPGGTGYPAFNAAAANFNVGPSLVDNRWADLGLFVGFSLASDGFDVGWKDESGLLPDISETGSGFYSGTPEAPIFHTGTYVMTSGSISFDEYMTAPWPFDHDVYHQMSYGDIL